MTGLTLIQFGERVPHDAQSETGGEYDGQAWWLKVKSLAFLGEATHGMPATHWVTNQVERLFASYGNEMTFSQVRLHKRKQQIAMIGLARGIEVPPLYQIAIASKAEWADVKAERRGRDRYIGVLLGYDC